MTLTWRPTRLAPPDRYPRNSAASGGGHNRLALERMSPKTARMVGLGQKGCPWRGSRECATCPFADYIARECDYRCGACPDYDTCPCGALTDRVTRSQLLLMQAVQALYELTDNGNLPAHDADEALARLHRWLGPALENPAGRPATCLQVIQLALWKQNCIAHWSPSASTANDLI